MSPCISWFHHSYSTQDSETSSWSGQNSSDMNIYKSVSYLSSCPQPIPTESSLERHLTIHRDKKWKLFPSEGSVFSVCEFLLKAKGEAETSKLKQKKTHLYLQLSFVHLLFFSMLSTAFNGAAASPHTPLWDSLAASVILWTEDYYWNLINSDICSKCFMKTCMQLHNDFYKTLCFWCIEFCTFLALFAFAGRGLCLSLYFCCLLPPDYLGIIINPFFTSGPRCEHPTI